MTQAIELHCCEHDCGSPADFEIFGESGHPEDTTHACGEHVGSLLGTPAWMDAENESWTVFAIPKGGT